MEDRLEDIERRITELGRRVQRIESLLNVRAVSPDFSTGETPVASSGTLEPDSRGTASLLPLAGRTLLALAGGFLLRALTDAGLVPAREGMLAGMAYAAVWLWLADRAGRQQRPGGVFHIIAAGLIAFPLVWETTARFAILPPLLGTAALVAYFGAGLMVSLRRGFQHGGLVITTLGVLTGMAMLPARAPGMVRAGFLALVIIAAVIEISALDPLRLARAYSARRRPALRRRPLDQPIIRWPALRWPPAIGLDLATLFVIALMSTLGSPRPAGPPLARLVPLVLAVPTIYILGAGLRIGLRGGMVGPLDIVQALIGLPLGIGGAIWCELELGRHLWPVGSLVLALGAACYAAAFAFVERRAGRHLNFAFFSSLALALTVAGTRLLMHESGLAVIWALLALIVAWPGARFDRVTLRMHAVLFLLLAVTSSGMLRACTARLVGIGDASLPVWWLGTVVTMMVVAVYGIMLAAPRPVGARWTRLLPHLAAAATAVWLVAGLFAGWLIRTSGLAVTDPGAIAALRTAVLAATAVGCAVPAPRWRLRELRWLALLLLALGALKLVLADLRLGRPLTLFISLGVYGLALILAPQLLKRPHASPGECVQEGAGR
jgi:hypothetical protein